MNVAAIRRHRILPVGKAADDGKERVKHRKAEDQERHRERHDGVILEKALNGDGRKDIAEEGRPRIAHEHLRRISVEGQKAEARAHKRGHHERHVTLGDEQRNDEHRNGADRGNAAGKAVKSVDEVDGICDAHDPQHRDGDRQPAKIPIRAIGKDVGV